MNAILHEPNEDVPRLVYADWLEERGDQRAEYLRLEIAWCRSTNARKSTELAAMMQSVGETFDPHWVRVVANVRNKAPEVVHELFFLEDGQGLIEVAGGEDETALLVEGKPIAFNWNDYLGSVGQYLVQTGRCRNRDYGQEFAAFVSGRVENYRLAERLAPLLSAFASGFYSLEYTPSSAMARSPDGWAQIVTNGELDSYYPFGRCLVCTQPHQALNSGRISEYRDQIRDRGARPIVVTTLAANAWCEFVIDGHHKLEAYHREHVAPAVVSIARWHAPAISLPVGVGFFSPGHPGIKEYQRMKRGGI